MRRQTSVSESIRPNTARRSRRVWLRQSLAAATGLSVGVTLPRSAWAQPAGADDAVRLAVVGLRTRGRNCWGPFNACPACASPAL